MHVKSAACRAQLQTEDTAIGQGQQAYMHSIQGGPADALPLVFLPGYGAGAAFLFRNLPSLCEHFRVYAVDPLGTGMSGIHHALTLPHVTGFGAICSEYTTKGLLVNNRDIEHFHDNTSCT